MEKILYKILAAILKAISPQIRAIVVEFIKRLEVEAPKTPNPWDDLLVLVLKVLLATEDS